MTARLCLGVVFAAVLAVAPIASAGNNDRDRQREQRQEQRAREDRQAQRAAEERQQQRAAAERQEARDRAARQELRQQTQAREDRLAAQRAAERARVDATNQAQLNTIYRQQQARQADLTADRQQVKGRLERQEQRIAEQRRDVRATPNAGDSAALAELRQRLANQRAAADAELARLRNRDGRIVDDARWDRQDQKLVNDIRVREFRGDQAVQDEYARIAEQDRRFDIQNREARRDIRDTRSPTQRDAALDNLMMTQQRQQDLLRQQREELATRQRAEEQQRRNARAVVVRDEPIVVRDRSDHYWYDRDRGSTRSVNLQPAFGRYAPVVAKSRPDVVVVRDRDDRHGYHNTGYGYNDRYAHGHWRDRYDDCDDDRFSFGLSFSSGSSSYWGSYSNTTYCPPAPGYYVQRPTYWYAPIYRYPPCPPPSYGYWSHHRPVYVAPPAPVYCKPVHIYHPGVISHWTYDCAPGCTNHSHARSRLSAGLSVTIHD